MPTKTFTGNGEQNFGIDARSDVGYRVMTYNGSLGGGTLRVFTKPSGAANKVPVADGKLSDANVDGNDDAVQQLVFISAGEVIIELSGSSGTLNLEVSVA